MSLRNVGQVSVGALVLFGWWQISRIVESMSSYDVSLGVRWFGFGIMFVSMIAAIDNKEKNQ